VARRRAEIAALLEYPADLATEPRGPPRLAGPVGDIAARSGALQDRPRFAAPLAPNAGYERADAARRRVVMSDACLTGMAFGLWRTTRSSSLTEQGSYGGGAAGPEALVSN
jgi:hypothetical protein